ncbi:MAG: hypothetical protein KAW52_00185 [candidate division Zixibacteria bacterium]|nr:hypothetical protein [candidate division Zixibacteria bacterium]
MGYHQSADQKLNKIDCLDLLQFQGLHLHKHAFTEALAAATLTVDAEDDGKIFLCSITTVITLPSVGVTYGPFTFVNYGDETDGISDVQISISPAAADLINGCDISAEDNHDIINTLATAKRGDLITIDYAGATGWKITRMRGTWAKEA